MDNTTGCQMLTKEKTFELLSSVARYVLLNMAQMHMWQTSKIDVI